MSLFHSTILTIFPEVFPGPLGVSLAGTALKKNIWSFNTINIRNYGLTKHKKIDDTMYGGGRGLIMRADVLGRALDDITHEKNMILYPSPRGTIFTQDLAHKIAQQKKITILCGRFEGIDERIIDHYNLFQVSVGDFIISGGEIATLIILDSVIRTLPGVISNAAVLENDSFSLKKGNFKLLEYPLYTKPYIWKNKKVPDVLVSGNQKAISDWKQRESLKLTQRLRPDLLE